MPKNLSTATAASPIEHFYTPIHERMVEQEHRDGASRPTMREFETALRRFAVRPDGAALDAGCGATATAAAAFARYGFRSVYAIDLNEQSLELARALLKRDGIENVNLSCGSVLALPFADESFDFAACIGVAHHTPKPEKAIEELARILKPGGRLYLSLYCFADSFAEWAVRLLRWVGVRVPFQALYPLVKRSKVWNNFILDHMYVPILWLFRASEVRELLAKHHLSIVAEWPSEMDPFSAHGKIGRWLTGDGLMRVWVCEKR